MRVTLYMKSRSYLYLVCLTMAINGVVFSRTKNSLRQRAGELVKGRITFTILPISSRFHDLQAETKSKDDLNIIDLCMMMLSPLRVAAVILE